MRKELKKNKNGIMGKIVLLMLILLVIPLASAITWSNETKTEFRIVSEYSYCYKEDGNVYWSENNNIVNAFNDCHREVVENGSANSCCPDGYDCVKQNGNWKCEFSGAEFCSDYATEDTCEDYSLGVAIHDNEEKSEFGEGFCEPGRYVNESNGCTYYVYNCRCEWNETACMSAYSTGKNCGTEDIFPASCYRPDSEATNCSRGFKFLKWDWYYKDAFGKTLTCNENSDCSIYSGLEDISCDAGKGLCVSENCKAGEKQIKCLSEVLLSFSNAASLIIAVIVIIIFYLIVIRERRKARKRKRKK